MTLQVRVAQNVKVLCGFSRDLNPCTNQCRSILAVVIASVIERMDGLTDFAKNEKPGGTFFPVFPTANMDRFLRTLCEMMTQAPNCRSNRRS
jgi:hypothetical protein